MEMMETSDELLTEAEVPETLAERIKKMLGNGIPGTMVASAVGCDPSYISQLMEDEQFKYDVLLLRAGHAESTVQRDKNWNAVEDIALNKALEMLPFVSRPSDLVRIAGMANAAKRRAGEFSGAAEQAASTVVNITLPAGAAVHFQMNSNSQVVEVDGRSMAALPTKNLIAELKARREARDAIGVVDVAMPALHTLQAPVQSTVQPTAKSLERKKVESILEKIGYGEDAEPVMNVLKDKE
jgi:hypothetical protein